MAGPEQDVSVAQPAREDGVTFLPCSGKGDGGSIEIQSLPCSVGDDQQPVFPEFSEQGIFGGGRILENEGLGQTIHEQRIELGVPDGGSGVERRFLEGEDDPVSEAEEGPDNQKIERETAFHVAYVQKGP